MLVRIINIHKNVWYANRDKHLWTPSCGVLCQVYHHLGQSIGSPVVLAMRIHTHAIQSRLSPGLHISHGWKMRVTGTTNDPREF